MPVRVSLFEQLYSAGEVERGHDVRVFLLETIEFGYRFAGLQCTDLDT